jgi:hypothetical protein
MAVSQPADSGNRLAAIVSIAGITSHCNSNELVAVCQCPLSVNSRKPTAATNHRTSFQWKCGKMITYRFEWAFHYQLFAAVAQLNWISHIFWLKGTVQRKLTGVETDINRKVFLSH